MPRDTALHAYWNFFESFNSRDPHEFSMALHYPHVRISWRQEPRIIADAEVHALNTSWQPVLESGWDHTVGAQPQIIHTSDSKWHIQGGWTRVDSNDSPILSNHVSYIVTRIDDSWGIQCRYGTDLGDHVSNESSREAHDAVEAFRRAIRRGSREEAMKVCGPSVYVVDVGFARAVSPPEFLPLRDVGTANIEDIHAGTHSATIALTGSLNSALLYLTDQNGWRIRAISWI